MARTEINQANITRTSVIASNIKAHMVNAIFYVEGDQILEAAATNVVRTAMAFQSEYERRGIFAINDPAVEKARSAALESIGALEVALVRARPNARAVSLGIDWH